ncbi:MULTISPECIES: 16S rRNA (guanine(527)-N(7))-methyltransferase RsmG [Salimicrobium]|uniref:Ribosomal RNA small subunit methyltransferase G n=3 Tax=Salimicrobium TaxID=351195 RepID=K2H6Y9_9BACI|nr:MULTISPECIES: 16S rRNA (guanine(527)-N(7))-methyltransferase RsmG [Salimicrobium]AKG03330.1 16S rRNA (guanine(527)-N(7))-methyltransferase RsmG [Salimicrobium jeotgali]EKE31490.1 16S rRNA methyltransferase GidB [Salimicrobium jeotgali]MBM7696721.1 16S rRNA (guanine527-N7)-methyltransferase [Salimicrobium jeotgali]SDY34615.1 16S rRNA (guanine527-N7)-methyltransferase [Salimicrobium album]SIS91869.1 16S rRNA m(7)G-527 methyltransferase [Salimicrobium salexigens]
MDISTFQNKLKEQGIELTEKQLDQFEKYWEMLVEWNEKMNLTAITEKGEVYEKHFYDSLTAAFYHDFSGPLRICDVGAGAGFPSLPLKIVFPELKVTIVDSLKKRIGFLNHLATELELNDVAFYHDRAENFGKNGKFREKYDLVLGRAVARMSVLSELCLPLVKKGGFLIAMKGPNAQEEMDTAESAISILGGETKDVHSFTLPEDGAERSIIRIEKRRKTPGKYPRKAGTPNKVPLS